MQHQLVKLKNNLNTLFVHNPGSTSGTVQIWFRAGSALERQENEGIAHFLEHMFFKGTATRPGAKIAHDVEGYGGEINAFTSFDYTCYYINTPSHELKQTIDILMDMVSNPEFKQEDLVPERDVVFEEFRRSIDSPQQSAFHKIQVACFEGAYGHAILGNENTIKNFSREQLKGFRNSFYNLSNAMLVVAGDIPDTTKTELTGLIEKYKLPEGAESSFPEFELKKNSSIDLHHKDVRMATITMCLQAPTYNSNAAAAEDLAINCLGHGETSRLYETLVLDQTLANTASASTMFMNKGGAHFIRVVCPPNNIKKVLAKLTEQFKLISVEGVNQQELQKIKNQYISSKVYELESIESYAFSLGHGYAQSGDINCEEEFINRIKKASKHDVNRAAKDIFTRALHINVQLPKDASLEKCKADLQKFQAAIKKLKDSIKKAKDLPYKIQTSKFDPQAQVIKLKPGVSLFYRQNKMTPTFILHAYLRGGLSEEVAANNGYHHLLATTLTKGFGKFSYEKMKLLLEDRSASLHGFSGKNAYGLLMHGLSDNFHELVPLFEGSLLRPEIPNKYLKHEKEIASRALENQKEDPVKHCFAEANQLFFNKHPYAQNGLGNLANIKKISQNFLLTTHKKNLKTKEILLTYCGDLELNEVIEHLKPTIDALPSRASKKVNFKKYTSTVGVEKYIKFDREQTQIFYGIPCGKMGAVENTYLKMLATQLSGQSSELFVEVRDRQGLCYSAQPVHFTALEGGYFGIYMASGHDKVKAAINAIKGIIGRIQNEGLTKDEFERIKTMIKGQNQINIQTNEDYASVYSVAILQDEGVDYWHKSNQEIEALSYENFQKGIKKVLSQKWNTVVVGREYES
jgi:zinc protease